MSVPTSSSDDKQYRLPTNVKPVHYGLVIQTDLEKLEFNAYVKISLDVVEQTSSITFNSNDLELKSVSLSSEALGTSLSPNNQIIDKEQQRVKCDFDQSLPAGVKAELKIHFSGKLTGSMTGYYISSYQVDGKKKYYTLTQFEPTTARKAFPCWDEPLLKATFAITMISREGTINLSNMNVSSEKTVSESLSEVDKDLSSLISGLEGQWKITKFAKTPIMSTYIVAYANGDFEYLEESVKLRDRTIPLRIYATSDNIHQAKFALQVKKDVLPLYEEVFDVPFPLPKLDTLVASDFDAGAMENWGLITGRTTAFLLDPERGDLAAKKSIARIQTHEVAHMWFGNITTMEWWNYLYLNEGFATLMGDIVILGKIFPEWKVDSTFASGQLKAALSLDAKLSSHPIEVDCPNANDINQIFDNLSYSKAASVLRMLSNYVGEDVFLKGTSLYLKRKLYGNAVTDDLWRGIAKAAGRDIVSLMSNWIEKVGFPVITVTETGAGSIKVRQDRFLENGLADEKDNQTIWNVPLGILSVGEDGKPSVDQTASLTEREQTFKVNTSQTYKLNAGTFAVYRVLYTPEHMSKLAQEATKPDGQGILTLNDRIGLLHDSMALSKAGLAKLSSALTLIEGLKGDTEYLVWSAIADNLSELVSIWWEYPEIVQGLDAFRRELFVPIVEKIGYSNQPGDSTDTIQLRATAITQAAEAGDPGVVKEFQARFDHYLKANDDSKIPADLIRPIYKAVVQHGGKVEHDSMLELYENGKTPTGKIAAVIALGSTQNPELQDHTFKLIAEKARDQDVIYFFLGLSKNFATRRALVNYYKDNYDTLYNRFQGSFTLKIIVEVCFENLSSIKDHDDVKAFFEGKDTSKFSMSLQQRLEGIKAKAAYIDRSTEDLEAWLKNRAQK